MSETKRREILQKLAGARNALNAALADLSAEAWETAVYAHDGAESWRVIDLVRHLMNAEQSMTRLMMQIRDGSEGVPADFDLDRWNARGVAKTKALTAAQLLSAMEQNRLALIQFIETLTDADWAKQGRHGSLRIMRIDEICHLIADHERAHLAEIKSAL